MRYFKYLIQEYRPARFLAKQNKIKAAFSFCSGFINDNVIQSKKSCFISFLVIYILVLMMSLVFLGFAFLASAITANKMILMYLSPTFFVGIRMLLAGILLIAFYYPRSHRLKLSYLKADYLKILGISLLTTCIPAILKAYGLKYLLSSKAAFLGGLDPFITAVFSYFLHRERFNFQKIVGLCLGFLGTSILLIGTSSLEEIVGGFGIFSYPEIAILSAVAIGRYGWLLAQRMLKRERYAPAEMNGLIMATSGVLALFLSYFIDTFSTMDLSNYSRLSFLMAWTVIIGNVFGYTLYGYALKLYSATFVALAGFSIPLYVAFFGYFLLKEPLTFNFFFALIVTFTGLYLFYQSELK